MPPPPLPLLLLLLLSLPHPTLPLNPTAPQFLTSSISSLDLLSLMSKHKCNSFSALLKSLPDAADSFASNLDSGLTAFCPSDPALRPFLPKFRNLTTADKTSLLLYHAIPVYYSLQMLQSNNGVVNSLATDGTDKNYNFTVQNDGEAVTLRTEVTTAKVTGTVVDRDPVAVYTIDAVLEPRELFRPVEALAPAPAPEAVADSPKMGKRKGKHGAPPAGSPDEAPADRKVADDSSGVAGGRGTVVGATILAVVTVVALVFP